MGTLLNRRRYMGGVAALPYDENSYIQDGLVFQLDGINKGSNQGYWTDLKGGCMFQVPEAEGLAEQNNCYTWTDNVNMPLHSGGIPQGVGCSVEIAMYNTVPTGTEKWGTFGSANGSTGGIINIGGFRNFQFNFINRCRYLHLNNLVRNHFTTVSYCSAYACVDKIEVALEASVDYLTGKCGVGNSYGIGMRGSVYAIRVYNRQLTLAEMQFNQDIDLKRFGT